MRGHAIHTDVIYLVERTRGEGGQGGGAAAGGASHNLSCRRTQPDASYPEVPQTALRRAGGRGSSIAPAAGPRPAPPRRATQGVGVQGSPARRRPRASAMRAEKRTGFGLFDGASVSDAAGEAERLMVFSAVRRVVVRASRRALACLRGCESVVLWVNGHVSTNRGKMWLIFARS